MGGGMFPCAIIFPITHKMRRGHNAAEHAEKPNPYQIAVEQFMIAADKLNLDEGMKQILSKPKRELTVNFPVRMDDGTIQGLHRLPRAALPHPRPRQGRHPLPPGRRPGRGHGPRHVDDLEMRHGRHPLRRRQRRRHCRPQAAKPGRDGAPHPPLRRRDHAHHRPRKRHPRPRRQHQRADHGLDHGHHFHDAATRSPASSPASPSPSKARWAATRPPAAACSTSCAKRSRPQGISSRAPASSCRASATSAPTPPDCWPKTALSSSPSPTARRHLFIQGHRPDNAATLQQENGTPRRLPRHRADHQRGAT